MRSTSLRLPGSCCSSASSRNASTVLLKMLWAHDEVSSVLKPMLVAQIIAKSC